MVVGVGFIGRQEVRRREGQVGVAHIGGEAGLAVIVRLVTAGDGGEILLVNHVLGGCKN